MEPGGDRGCGIRQRLLLRQRGFYWVFPLFGHTMAWQSSTQRIPSGWKEWLRIFSGSIRMRLSLQTSDDKGKVSNWKLELGSLGMLSKYGGWTPATVKRGDHITVQGFKAKDGSPYFSVGRIWLPDGRSLEGKP